MKVKGTEESLNHQICGDESIEAGRGPGQLEWYKVASGFCKNKSVLDVGCGLGAGMNILRDTAASVQGQDLDPRLKKEHVTICDLSEIASKSYDVITAIDVIEHVEEDEQFVRELGRISRSNIFVTTPNYTCSRNTWPYHIREYTPMHLNRIMSLAGNVSMYKGTPDGSECHKIRHKKTNALFNHLRINRLTAFPTRCFNHLMASPLRIHSHLAALVDVA